MAMVRRIIHTILICSACTLAACSFSLDNLWSSVTGDKPKKITSIKSKNVKSQKPIKIPIRRSKIRKKVSANPTGAPPVLGKTNFVPPDVKKGKITGTFVGRKVQTLRSELRRMRDQIGKQNRDLQKIRRETSTHAQAYHLAIASINVRLQVGTTPGNPFLVNKWNVAQSGLSKIDQDVSKMNSLANAVAGTSTMSGFLLETTRAAYGLSGAVEEDHQQLAILEDEVNRTVVLIDRILNELSEDINRQTSYVAAERNNLTALSLAIKNGEVLGGSLSNRISSNADQVEPGSPVSKKRANNTINRRPLVIIRFDRTKVAYEQPLYNAINRVLQRRPHAGFDLVAVASAKGSPAQVTVASNKSRRHAEKVLRSLSEMGLPLQRVRLSAMTSKNAKTNEVHLYVH